MSTGRCPRCGREVSTFFDSSPTLCSTCQFADDEKRVFNLAQMAMQEETLAIHRRQEAEREEKQRQQEAEKRKQARLQTVNHVVSLAKSLPQELAGASPEAVLLALAREAHYFGDFDVWNWLAYDAEFPHLVETAYDQIQRTLAQVLVATWNALKEHPASAVKTVSALVRVFAYTSMAVMRTMQQELIQAKAGFDARHRDELAAMEAMKNESDQLEAQLNAERSGFIGSLRTFWHGSKAYDPRFQQAHRMRTKLTALATDFANRKNAFAAKFVLERIDPQLRPITSPNMDQPEGKQALSVDTALPSPSTSREAATPSTPRVEKTSLEAGLECLKQKKYEDAISLLTEEIRLHPRNTQAYLGRACAHDTLAVESGPHHESHISQALADLSEAIRLDPTFSPAYEERGWMYLQLDEEDKGIADLKEAIRLDPGNKDAKCKLAGHYVDCSGGLEERQPDKALDLYKTVLNLDPGNGDGGFGPMFFAWPGTAYLRNGQIKEAIRDFVQGIKRSGNMDAAVGSPSTEEERGLLDDAVSLKNKGDALWARQEYREAYEAYGGPDGECGTEGAIGFEPGFTRAIVENMEATLRVLEAGADIGTMLDDPTAHVAALHAHMHTLKGQRDHRHMLAFRVAMNDYLHDAEHQYHQTMQRIWNSLGH